LIMTLFEVVFKITHDCPFCNLSKKYPNLKMYDWCNREHDVFELVLDKQEDYPAILKELSKYAFVTAESCSVGNVHLVTRSCACDKEGSITYIIDGFNVLHVSPVVYEKGWEYYRIVAFRERDVKELLQKFEEKGLEFEVIRRVPFDGFIASSLTLTADALFSDLTAKQVDALLTAYNYGYYQLPRKADVKTIASSRHIPRTTFQEHLKKAENKLLISLAPYVQLFKDIPAERMSALKTK
jgi:predicted DNA binding protein